MRFPGSGLGTFFLATVKCKAGLGNPKPIAYLLAISQWQDFLMGTILIIDDEKDILNMLGRILELEGYEVLKAADAGAGRKLFESKDIQAVIVDVKLPDGNGIKLTAEFKAFKPQAEVICLTAYGNIPDGVQAIKNGAFDYLVKGDDNHKIIPLVSKAMEKARLQFKVARLQSQLQEKYGFDNIIGHSRPIKEAIELAQKVAPMDTTVLLQGPTGTGKEVFARAIHAGSTRAAENFLAVNCSALGKGLLESELFAHKAGAFTSAHKDKSGLFEEAHRGTIFLDEIGEMPPELQAKILRVLEAGTFIKLGDTRETKVDVRVIAATNRDLEQEVQKGNFREDLFYRISVFAIELPSLNERKEDIPALAEHFMRYFAVKSNKLVTDISSGLADALLRHEWKGNIRELRNIIERAVILADTPSLSAELLPFDFLIHKHPSLSGGTFALKDMEKTHIANMLAYTRGNKAKAAKLLGIGLTTLYNKIREYGL